MRHGADTVRKGLRRSLEFFLTVSLYIYRWWNIIHTQIYVYCLICWKSFRCCYATHRWEDGEPTEEQAPWGSFHAISRATFGGYQRLSWATILREPQHIPGAYPRHPQNPKWKELLHKLLVGDPGCVPGICSKILRLMLWFPSQQALQWFEDSRQVVEYAEFLGMDLKTEMFGAPAKMLHFLTLIMDFPFEHRFWKNLQQDT